MQTYNNLDHHSGITGYETGEDFIKIQFRGGRTYLYTDQSTGSYNVECMKHLAQRGKGLNSFINDCIRKRYLARESKFGQLL